MVGRTTGLLNGIFMPSDELCSVSHGMEEGKAREDLHNVYRLKQWVLSSLSGIVGQKSQLQCKFFSKQPI